MNSREEQFAEFVYESVSGHKPRNEFEREGVLELRHRSKTYSKSPEFDDVRKKMGEKFRQLKEDLSSSIRGTESNTLRRHL